MKKAVLELTSVITNGSAYYHHAVEAAFSNDSDQELVDVWLDCFEIEENKTPYIWGVDWKEAPSEIEFIVKALLDAKEYRVNEQAFVFADDIDEMQTDDYLNALRERLIEEGIILVYFDRGSDGYELVVVEKVQYAHVRNLSNKLGFIFDMYFC